MPIPPGWLVIVLEPSLPPSLAGTRTLPPGAVFRDCSPQSLATSCDGSGSLPPVAPLAFRSSCLALLAALPGFHPSGTRSVAREIVLDRDRQ
jgi:hypothetical protein